MPKTYLFYDTETTGLNPCFDQILQFAAIRTDEDFNELERHQFFIRLNPDVIPAPYAMMTHLIRLDQLKTGQCEYEAIQEIHQLVNTPETISVGYNTLGFDDEFLRFSFYRNLLPSYTHQWANGCSRLDLFPIVTLYFLHKKESLRWPENNGKTNLKLENLNALNHLADGQAHDAMVDVEATLALAKKLKSYTKMWDYAVGYFNKNTDVKRFRQLPIAFESVYAPHREALLVASSLGPGKNYQAPVLCLGSHLHYKNQMLWLRLDKEDLIKTTGNTIAQHTYVLRKRFGEQPILLPPLPRFLEQIDEERLKLADKNKTWLKDHSNILQLICDYYQNYKYPEVPACDLNANLYIQPFPTPEEEYQCRQFHQADIKTKCTLLSKFENDCLKMLAIRLIGRNFKDELSDPEKTIFQRYLESIFSNDEEKNPVDYKNQKHLSPKKVLEQIEGLMQKELNSEEKEILEELKDYLGK